MVGWKVLEDQLNDSTPTFSYRNGEYFKDGQPLDVLLELCELTGEVECYEGMKEGVSLRIANLEKEIAELQRKLAVSDAKLADTQRFMDDVRNAARNRHPDGVTVLDFFAVWNEQYEKRIAELTAKLTAVGK